MSEKVEVVKLDTLPAQASLKELRNELKAVKDQMAGLEEGSDAFLEAANKAGTLKHKLDEINESVKGASADFGDMLSSGTKTVQGIMGGFQAAQGALTLFGVESEEVTKAILKMQASMAIIQGLDAIDNGIKGFKKFTTAIQLSTKGLSTFKKALIGTGIGAIVVLIGELIAHFDDLDKLTGGKLTKSLNGLKGVFKNLGTVVLSIGKLLFDYLITPFKVIVDLVKGIGNIIKAVFNGDFDEIGDIVDETFSNLGDTFNNLARDMKNVGKAFSESFNEGVEEGEKEAEKRRKDEDEKKKKELEAKRKLELELYRKNENEKLNIKLERNKRSKASDDDKLKNEIEIEKLRLKLMDKNTLLYEQLLTKIAELEALVGEDARNQQKEKDDKAADDEKRRKEQEQKDIESLKNKYLTEEELFAADIAKKRELLKQSLKDEVITKEEYAELLKQIDDEVTNHKLANIEKDKEAENAAIQAKIKMSATMANSIANILSSFADAQDTNTKEGFERSKKLQIASATIQMLTGIATALSGAFTTKSGPWDIALAAVQAASIATAGGINIAKIKATKFEGGGSSSVSSGAVSSTIVPPQMYSNAVQGASTEQTISESKSYVAVTEIDRVSNRVNVAENESRY